MLWHANYEVNWTKIFQEEKLLVARCDYYVDPGIGSAGNHGLMIPHKRVGTFVLPPDIKKPGKWTKLAL